MKAFNDIKVSEPPLSNTIADDEKEVEPNKIVSDKNDVGEYESDPNAENDDVDDNDEHNENSDDDQTLVCEVPNEGLVATTSASAASKNQVTDTKKRTDYKNSSVSCIDNISAANADDEKFKETIDNGLKHVDTESEKEGKEIVEISRNSTGSLKPFFCKKVGCC